MSMTVADRVETREEDPSAARTGSASPDAVRPPAVPAAPPAFNTIPEPPGRFEKVLLLTGWFLVERFVAVVLFFKKGEFH